MKISQSEDRTQARSEELWHSSLKESLSQRAASQRTLVDLDQENKVRKEMAERLFPLPTNDFSNQEVPFSDADVDITEDEFDDVFR